MDKKINDLKERKHTLFTSTISGEVDEEVVILGKKLTEVAEKQSFAAIVGSLWLGRELKSLKTENFIDLVLKLLVDHGPYQSGAVNTIISARAGKDLVSSLVSGLLTIGPRFGGAINASAQVFYTAVSDQKEPAALIEEFAHQKRYIPGIGHKKYRIDMPDPRVKMLQASVKGVGGEYLKYAQQVEKITSAKKPNLILNVDGTIAAILLDLLTSEEQFDNLAIQQLIEAEFFNAFFVLSRSVGFIAHYLDQKRLNEGLFRLNPDEVFSAEIQNSNLQIHKSSSKFK
ncbi:MAG: citrate/2-methylcitrate synthase [Patescibacteria group bacterium]|jgi:ATP-citrate lyase alpha-subunit